MSLDGTYDIVVKTPMGEQKSTLTVTTAGEGWSGTQTGPDGSDVAIENGSIEGNTLRWKSRIEKPMPMDLDSEATIDEDIVTGSVTAGAFGSFPLTGTRVG